jgi:hypothetical protein
MTNRFGVVLHAESMRWAASEGVSETGIAAGLLLHERSVEEIVATAVAPYSPGLNHMWGLGKS